MNAQGLDPFHTSGSEADTHRLERDLAAPGHRKPDAFIENSRALKLLQSLRRLIKAKK
jgi:hypothetical protein